MIFKSTQVALMVFLIGCNQDNPSYVQAEKERTLAQDPPPVKCRPEAPAPIILKGVALPSNKRIQIESSLEDLKIIPLFENVIARDPSSWALGCTPSVLQRFHLTADHLNATPPKGARTVILCGQWRGSPPDIQAEEIILVYFLSEERTRQESLKLSSNTLRLIGRSHIQSNRYFSIDSDLNQNAIELSVSRSIEGDGRLTLASFGYSCR